jgi:mutator protein MutT
VVRLRISVKGILINDAHVLLLKNERNEWELPGGTLEPNEAPEQCVIREIKEELNLVCSVKKLIDVRVFEVLPGKHVLIVAYLCECDDYSPLGISDEHLEYGWFSFEELSQIPIPEGYVISINKAKSAL